MENKLMDETKLVKIRRIIRLILIAEIIAVIVVSNLKVVVTTYVYGSFKDKVTGTCTYTREEISLFGRHLGHVDGRLKLKEVENFKGLKKDGTMTTKRICWRKS